MSRASTGLRYSGLGVAVLGFLLTRLLVAETLEADAASFMVAGLIPLAAGLGLTVFGVALAVGAYSPAYARTVWLWSAFGTLAMGLVLATTVVHSVLVGEGFEPFFESTPLVANVLLGGAIGGTIVGDRSATNRRQREDLARYAERTMLVNRLLRHEILNAAAVVKGYASTLEERADDEASTAIHESAEHIEDTIAEVSAFAGTDGTLTPVDLHGALESVLADLPSDGELAVDQDVPPGTVVRADERLELLVRELVENAFEHAGPEADVEFSATVDHRTATLSVTDDGPGLPNTAQEVLYARALPEYDDPTLGYGLQMVRMLVEHYDGDVSVDTDDGTEIAVTLQRTTDEGVPALGLGVPTADLARAGGAAVIAGVAMGALVQVASGTMPVIGALYGVESLVVGWVTHLFHSVVFGLLFAAGAATGRLRDVAASARGRVGLGIGWGVALWLVAAGLVMPVWLTVVRVPATVPNLEAVGLAAHVLWGGLLGWLSGELPVPSWLVE